MAINIMLDAGHYGKYNRSPANGNYYESEMNWKLHLLLQRHLVERGFKVSITRNNQNNDLSVTARGRMAKGQDLLISIHANAVEGSGINENVDYPVAFVQLNGSGRELGQKLADCVAEVMDTKQKGRTATREGKNGDYYGVLRGAAAVGTTAIILEHSFYTNTKMVNWLLEEMNLDKLAQAESEIIAAYYAKKTVTVTLPQVKKGSKCSEVCTLQMLLNAHNYKGKNGQALEADGSFGGNTDFAVRAFQNAKALSVDGVVGQNTWSALLKGD